MPTSTCLPAFQYKVLVYFSKWSQICSAKGEQRKIEDAVKAHQARCGFRLVQGRSGMEGVWPKSMFWIQYN
ncbi:hypothetical protein I7I53_08680 [Histoplasma capsulatum var. duboisii H88]|uniref:Uncharacterized protein n=1 Tax=Ajellomyces capsulatus (strain H88) TaxID=544711 RepID=A0A8A1LGA4_AJEC8|nr:hypothetical protein I7I53_08680 [Histoplasma capsulatum var. duboisii H88]